NLYSESKFYEDSVVDLFGDDGTNILNELKVMLYDQNLRNSYLCDSLMSGVDDYWLPAYSELNKECLWLHTGQKYEHTVLNTPESERIYIHKKGELDNTVVKTMTIGLASQLTTSTFFVSAITPDNRSISIEQLRDKGLKVSIYTYHQDQIPELSLYTSDPNNEFEFTTGETGISFNAGARYWQVFNIEEGPDHSIAPIQSIETDIVDIRCNISEDFENCSR
ncbi:MAG: hypothetical protein HOG08_03675, partial [Candidatus Magasanikbacteria bacterium]|nr:hypothetical protein [Candidatus Magasanikbacteria bacterium]